MKIDEAKLKDKYGLSLREYEAICDRTDNLLKFEETTGTVISRCNGSLKSTKVWLKKRLSKEETEHCIKFFEDHGGCCNCEILFNVLPYVGEMQKEVQINED